MNGVSITPLAREDAARILRRAGDAPAWMPRMLAETSRLFQIRSAHMPGLACVGATVALDDADARAFGGASISGTGAGLDMADAIAGCLGELAEHLSQFEREGDLVASDPLPPLLDAGWLGAAIAGRDVADCARARDPLSGADYRVPADLCFRRPPHRRMIDPVGPLSAGCATGPTFDDAATRAILELIERDAAAFWRFGGQRARIVSRDHPAAAEAAAFLAQLRQAESSRRTILLDITTDIGAPVIAAASCDGDGRGFACGLAARLNPADAARAALRELGQMEFAIALARAKLAEGGETLLNETDRRHLRRAALQVSRSSLRVADNDQDRDFGERRTIGRDLPSLLRHLADRSLPVYLINQTSARIGSPAVRAIAPRLQPFVKHVLTPRFAAAAPHGGVHDELLLY